MTKRYVSLPDEAESGMREFIDEVDRRLASDEDTCSIVEDVLIDLSGDREAYERWQRGESVSAAERVRLQSYDPCNTTLESEYYAEKDEERFRRSKHLQWLWRQFDSLPIADNVEFALRFRRMLADHLFEECGDNCRFFKGITFTYGHNITIGDNTVVHDDVHLDDRGKLTIGDRVSISDGVHVYSHDHDVVDQTEVRNYHTIVEDDVRLTYDAMVRAGCKVGENAIVGARGIVQNDVPAHHIAIGMPATSVKIKPGWEDVATPVDEAGTNRQAQRRIEYDVPDDLEVFDEFGRNLQPPE
ncbi:transferase hexapeptide repeat containing protein [Natrinema pellirubrum DSM 15624]|uniref:Acetyltransferase (Isoleucine patch superfamily) n=1 Tax=Natrinema pellirubrum (strain DSM 15624 / CIP 106293 / JCM 10476 / NCIMB 786 / 157) TaxID=797303 RepID=L0JFR0_NATP1|nr:acyltransferase [Natrinema pellirubrum]AGB30350.1 acetyltransferase (isoleucine patch superfamily) [Natrinema pellirubrum DSM 15624]ELY79270.1 transferase hexapeptide repeat containing protein [Natrinema pellirubrum DSM 15624]